jgi:hypothetical protein
VPNAAQKEKRVDDMFRAGILAMIDAARNIGRLDKS